MDASGFSPDDYEEDVDIWPENIHAVQFFDSLGHGAWSCGMNGISGLRYEALPFQFRMFGIKKRDWPEMFRLIQVMESAALEAMRSKT